MDELQKENFGLKMQIYFLEETLAQSSPDGLAQIQKEVGLLDEQQIHKQNVQLKAEMEGLKADLERHQADIEALIEHARESQVMSQEMQHEKEQLEAHIHQLELDRDGFEAESANKDQIVAELSDLVETLQQRLDEASGRVRRLT